MKGWEVWSHVDAKGCVVRLPRLLNLHLIGCPNLKGNLPVHAPLLAKLDIVGCGQLSQILPWVPYIHTANVHSWEFAIGFIPTFITELKLVGLVQLVSLPPVLFILTSLRYLKIVKCHNLKLLTYSQLPSMLKTLEIKECEALMFIPNGMEVLMHLKEISLCRFSSLRWAPRNFLPTSLKSLYIIHCVSYEFPIPMDIMQHYTSLELLHLENAGCYLVSFPLGSFTNLRYLDLRNCKGLESVYIPEERDNNSLTSLSMLNIVGYPKLEMIGKETGCGEATVLPTPNLTHLTILNCEKVKLLVMIGREGEVLLPNLLCLANSFRMAKSLCVTKKLVKFSCLTVLIVRGCEEVECFPDSNKGWGSLPTSLTTLWIRECPNLRKLDGKTLHSLKNLETLMIHNCPKLEGCPKRGCLLHSVSLV